MAGFGAGAAGIGAAGGIIGSAISAAFAAKQAKLQRAFQKEMYQNRYQYTMDDMRSAGLNPILAYQQGVGNPGAGSMAGVPDFGSSMAKGASAGLGAYKAASEKRAIDQGTATAEALGKKHDSERAINEARLPYEAALGDFFSNMPEAAQLQKILGLVGGAGGLLGAYGMMRGRGGKRNTTGRPIPPTRTNEQFRIKKSGQRDALQKRLYKDNPMKYLRTKKKRR